MQFIKRFIIAASLIGSAFAFMPVAQASRSPASHFINEDDVFLALRDAARSDDAARSIDYASRLSNYPLSSYVEYYRLKPRIRNLPTAEIREFLTRHEGAAIADRLRADWLLELGRRRDWASFDEQYAQLTGDELQVKCFALMSKALKKQTVADEARSLLVSPRDYGEPCHSLIATLAQSGQFTSEDVWAQIRLSAETGYMPAARRLSALTSLDEKSIERAIEKPVLTVVRGVRGNVEEHQLYIIALGRLAKGDVEQAAHALAASQSKLTPAERALAWAQIALQASYKLRPETLADYWSKTADAPLSSEAYQWRVRMALRAGDWEKVKSYIEAMPVSLRSHPAWIYWTGRALKETGKREEAQKWFESIADQVHFYGQLATEDLGRPIVVSQTAKAVAAAELVPIAANSGFKRALKLFELNMRPEAIREWNWELRKMNEREHLVAAEFARRNSLLDRMVNTSDRTKSEVDFHQRYPTPFQEFMHRSTTSLGLDMAWVYGLIRQESRFVMNARSHVGASGLMQVMPETAKYVARKIGLVSFNPREVNDIGTNIQLGTNYLNMVLKDLDGSQALATAAYNAGPGRPRAWRSTLTRPVEGAIFAETIPFTETRGYVKNVLSNATYYAALFEGKPQSLKARLGVIAPKNQQ
jgi:soluble lytic murein transglycosylase